MMKNNLVSIAMATYNGEKFISEQLDSILSQSHSNLEIIVCDDGSTDSTPDVLQKYSQKDDRIKLFFNEKNLGLIKNFEKAISLCQGKYIALSDQDDVWEPKKIELLLAHLSAMHDTGYVFSDAYVVDETLQSKNYTLWESKNFSSCADDFNQHPDKQVKILLKYPIVFGMSMMFKSTLKEFIFPFSSNFSHDNWISLIGSSTGLRGYALPQPLVYYRQHKRQMCGVKKDTIMDTVTTVVSIPSQSYIQELNAYTDLGIRLISIAQKLETPYLLSAHNVVNEKIAHLQQRIFIRKANRILKFKLVAKELFTLRYFLFSNGIKSIIRDLFLDAKNA